jgi:protein arginine N-methyltransferase 2
MAYKDETLTFEDNKIYYSKEGETFEVMMSWESPIMEASANYICSNGGNILEIGFGMGISANYIQANSINSHTIVECHPQILEKSRVWAADKPNVTIIEGEWFNIKDSLSTYDGVFYDTFGEDDWSKFGSNIESLIKSKSKVTWWNNNTNATTIHNINGVTYEIVYVNPPSNSYFNSKKYYMPKKEY